MATHKVFNDPIHGTVELHPILVKIIDTPQFQRLRYIKQLGGVYFVYPGASHNRFEHSIGVAHLAGELVTALKTGQPELKITNRDVLCVQIAGLCHDLGHGPFSYLFETFIHEARSDKKDWKHEEATLQLFDYMALECKLQGEEYEEEEDNKKTMKKLEKIDLTFIKEMIKGQSPEGPNPSEGRPDKSFLYEIVANKRNGIDVDKFDYLARDAHHLGIKTNFDHLRFIKFARVCEADGKLQICTRDKEVNNLYELFHIRHTLYKKAYQHSVSNIIESMITKAFLKADKHIQIQGSKGKTFTLSKAIDDMEAYTKLTDRVYEEILHSSALSIAGQGGGPPPAKVLRRRRSSARECSSLDEAKNILSEIVARKHPRCLGERKLTKDMINKWKNMTPEDEKDLKRRWEEDLAKYKEGGLTPEDFEVHIIELDYGMKSKNPIDEVRFYNKRNPEVADKLPDYQKSDFHQTCFSEQLIRVYYKKTENVKKAYEQVVLWCKEKLPIFMETEEDLSPPRREYPQQ